MARIRSRIVSLGLALASGATTSGLLYTYLTSLPAEARAPERVPLVVSGPKVDGTRPLAAGDLAVVMVAQRPNGAFATIDEITGRLPLVPVPPGQPILSSHLAAPGALTGLWQRVPQGQRAITIPVNEVAGVGGFLRPGLTVDVLGVTHDQTHWDCATVAQNVPILAVAQDDTPKPGEEKPRVASSATLLVAPEQAESISLAGERGTIRLVLRGPNDHFIRKVKPPAVFKLPQPPVPRVNPPLAPHPVTPRLPLPLAAPVQPAVEIIRGTLPEESH